MENVNKKPENYLVWSILSTVLCCLPLGIVSIVYSTKVDSLWATGNHQEAIDASNNAKKWAMIGAGAGLVFSFLYLIVVVIAALADM